VSAKIDAKKSAHSSITVKLYQLPYKCVCSWGYISFNFYSNWYQMLKIYENLKRYEDFSESSVNVKKHGARLGQVMWSVNIM